MRRHWRLVRPLIYFIRIARFFLDQSKRSEGTRSEELEMIKTTTTRFKKSNFDEHKPEISVLKKKEISSNSTISHRCYPHLGIGYSTIYRRGRHAEGSYCYSSSRYDENTGEKVLLKRVSPFFLMICTIPKICFVILESVFVYIYLSLTT